MKVLLTNDDGIHADGIVALRRSLEREGHEVWTVAPDRQRSGISHAITLKHPGRIRKTGEREYSCSGTPVDCVILAGLGAIPFRPEAVVSGINQGPNLGTDIVVSGTCGAARQAALDGLPAIAVSCASYEGPFLYGAAASFVARNLSGLVASWLTGTFININVPSSEDEDLGAVWVSPGKSRYLDNLTFFHAPDGDMYCFLAGGRHEICEAADCDHPSVASGLIALSPILVDPQTPPGFLPGAPFA